MNRGIGSAGKTGFRRQGARVVAVGALGAATAVLAVTPAFAKGDVVLNASPGTVRAGHTVHVTGHGASDAVRFAKLCAQERTGTRGGWHTVACGRITEIGGNDAKVDAKIKVTRRGVVQFRGVLYGVDGPRGGHPHADMSTPVRTVHVR
ncbi:hypothetical protein ACFC8N_41600 [Streptomyces sp. NPDC055966]|uniref:hypothetical protein n=1 Tax=Streptomyces sp. NPDC055966 TaxID=3345669 RepID=UPI0035DBCAF7